MKKYNIDVKSLKKYRNNWKIVNRFETIEQRKTNIDIKWQQLNAILNIAIDLGISPDQSKEDYTIIQERWDFLKKDY